MDEQSTKEIIVQPQDKSVPLALRILVTIVVIYTIYFAKMILLPILFAAFIALFASPLVRYLEKARIPKPVASLLLEALLISAMIYVAALLFEPALRWLEAAPVIGDRVANELKNISSNFNNGSANMDSQAGGNIEQASSKTALELAMDSTLVQLAALFAQTTLIFIMQAFAVVIIIYFFLVYGDDLMRNIVRAQETFSGKKLTVVMFTVIRDDVSMYILLVSLINAGLGICTALALSVIDFEDALLWGALAAILNFAPYVGPFILVVILTAVGLSEHEPLFRVLLAPGIFLALNLIESQFVTPTLLGRRFNINPLLVVLWMFIWGWLWGVGGMLVAIPLLMCLKLIFFHLRLIGDWVEVLNGNHHNGNHHEDNRENSKKVAVAAQLTKSDRLEIGDSTPYE